MAMNNIKDEVKTNKQTLQTTVMDTSGFLCSGESLLYVYRPAISVTPSSDIGRLKERASHKMSDRSEHRSVLRLCDFTHDKVVAITFFLIDYIFFGVAYQCSATLL